MHPTLKDILEEKRREIDEIKKGSGLPEIDQGNLPERDFRGAISGGKAIRLIAEIKFASPSAGRLREKSDPLTIGKDYEEAGA
ncbi:indole-3-glycerol phosphate synthase, partial [Thermodesulfobacteriota bacterium]